MTVNVSEIAKSGRAKGDPATALRIPCHLAFVIVILLSIPSAGNSGIEVDGECKCTTFQSGMAANERHFSFKAFLNGDYFLIKEWGWPGFEYLERGKSTNFEFTLVKYDLDMLPTNAIVRTRNGTANKFVRHPSVLNEATLILDHSEVPEGNYLFVPVWLAYASGPHYRRLRSGSKVTPIWEMGQGRQLGIAFRAVWEFNTPPPQCLMRFADFNDGNRYEGTGLRTIITPMPDPFQGGSTNSIYDVTAWTNAFGLVIPLQFRLTRFVPDFKGHLPTSLQVRQVFDGVTKAVGRYESPECFVPILPHRTRIVDNRLLTAQVPVGGIDYMTTSNRILSETELMHTKRYIELASRVGVRQGSRGVQLFLILLFVLALAFPALKLVQECRNKQRQSTKTTS